MYIKYALKYTAYKIINRILSYNLMQITIGYSRGT